MINKQLLDPKSIVIVGGSIDNRKPGGKVLKNIIDGGFKGKLYAVNPKESEVQGIKSYNKAEDLPDVDLAIIAIPAAFCVDLIDVLANKKNTRAFIILSAGFSEVGAEGKIIEDKIVKIINSVDGVLIGPNGVGVLTPNYHGVFTEPIPKLDKNGVDFISGSGATAVFIIETGVSKGLTFANIFSVGNSAQTGVEDILKYMDETFSPEKSPKIKLLYLENINNPRMLLKHASSLIRKGCKIAAIKAGSSDAGSRAASSHTGALASSDVAVDALFKKAGIVRCYGRNDLASVASVFKQPKAKGNNFAIITHAGGPAVMLTDVLSKGGLKVPEIKNEFSKFLMDELFAGSSVSNPIDFLATGTASQLGTIIEYTNKKFDEIDAMAVIFGTPGLFRVFDAYEVLNSKMQNSLKPIYPVLPSETVAKEEIEEFVSKGNVYFPDEVILGEALTKVYNTPEPANTDIDFCFADEVKIRKVITESKSGYLEPEKVQELLDAVEIPRAKEGVFTTKKTAKNFMKEINFPIVMKVVGPVHKSDVGGVILNINSIEELENTFDKLMQIKDAEAVLIQPMVSGMELFVGAKKEDKFGHLILVGLGGIFIEALKDVSAGLAPLSENEALSMIKSLKSYKIIQGIRGQAGADEHKLADIMVKLSALLHYAPEIAELDLNPLLAEGENIIGVDARIRIEK
ncbi:MAG: acetate--CoA ligase family protein [Bacteroidales bacterium]|nr:acetate--CoA ligase family protein [Bacteroidales bacterium]MBN2757616.1 acetate--CoA ligase family protein [Bacteroidales bacterium]